MKTVAQKFDFNTILFLDLSKKNIFSIGCLPELENLLTLDLSGNQLSGITGLEKCRQLKMLKLSYNKVSNAAPLVSG